MNRLTQEIEGDIRLSYLHGGKGQPLLFIHGFTGTAMADMAGLIEEFQAEYQIIAPDLRGYGASRPPNRVITPDFYQRDAADMAAFLDGIDCGPVVVLGFSDGAEVSLLLAATRPDLVRGVVAWGVCGVISDDELISVQSWLPVSSWGPSRATWRRQIIERHGEEQLESLVSGWVEAAQAIHAAGGNISLEQSENIKCPVLLLNGDGEVGNTPADAQRLSERITDSRLVFIRDSGHSIQDDQPEIFIKYIREFLNGLEETNVEMTTA